MGTASRPHSNAVLSVVAVCVLLLIVTTAFGQDTKDSIDRDYKDELPRTKPLSPQESLEHFKVAPGYRIELVASEPNVTDPIAMSFDEFGRIYVVEMRDYSEHPDESLGRIRLLEDQDGDGFYERSHLFAEHLSWPTAIIASQGGVYVGAPPFVFFLKDTDGDSIADEKRVVFEGFGRTNVQGLMNSFRFGLDRQIHGATSSSGAVVTIGADNRQHSEQPVEKFTEPLTLRGRDFSFDPLTERLEARAGGGQHGLSFNSVGEKFVCANSNHIQFMRYDDRYLTGNPYAVAQPNRVDIPKDGPQGPVFRSSPIEPWRIVRTRLRVQGIVPGPVEGGGTPAGYFTGSTGITIYRGDNWPSLGDEYAIVADVGSNLIHRKAVFREGLSYVAERVDEESEFIASDDIWFRPVQFRNGPDGALYVLDMYREVIEHPKSLPPVIKRHLDLDSGRDKGRIYRIVYEGDGQSQDDSSKPSKQLGDMAPPELVEQLRSPNGWIRETSARLLVEKKDRSVLKQLRNQLAELQDITLDKSHASHLISSLLWTLSVLDSFSALSSDDLLTLLSHPDPDVRIAALKWSEPFLQSDPKLQQRLLEMVKDVDVRVRLQLAFSLGKLSGQRKLNGLATLALLNPNEPLILMAVHASAKEQAESLFLQVFEDQSITSHVPAKEFLQQLLSQIVRDNATSKEALIEFLVNQVDIADAENRWILTTLDQVKATELLERVQDLSSGKANQKLRELGIQALAVVTNENATPEDRIDAISKLRWADNRLAAKALLELLTPQNSPQVQQAALVELSRIETKSIANRLLKALPEMSPAVQTTAVDVLLSNREWTIHTLEAIKQGEIKLEQFGRSRLIALSGSSQTDISELAQTILEANPLANRQDVVDQYLMTNTDEGDSKRGREVFSKSCASCHRVGELGTEIGPQLVAAISRGREFVTTNVFDPNREVNPLYVTTTIVTANGQVISGMIVEESPNSITLHQADKEPETILRVDIESMQSTGMSLMPEGLEKELDTKAFQDLLSFLESAATEN